MRISDWSSDVCSSDLLLELGQTGDDRVGGGEGATGKLVAAVEQTFFDARGQLGQRERGRCRRIGRYGALAETSEEGEEGDKGGGRQRHQPGEEDRKSTRRNSSH